MSRVSSVFPELKKVLTDHSIVIVGIPYDQTESFRRGAQKGPDSIRLFTDSIECFSPKLGKDLSQVDFVDLGNLAVENQSVKAMFKQVDVFYKQYGHHKILALGGEHLISYPCMTHYAQKYPNLHVLHLDAHTDLRAEWEGGSFTHCTFLRQFIENYPNCTLVQVGVRSGTQEEFGCIQKNPQIHSLQLEDLKLVQQILKDQPVYLTLDLDLLDPGLCPGVCNPEPGGISFLELQKFLKMIIPALNLVSGDIVELAPKYDISSTSSVTAAAILREILLLMG